MLSLDTAHFIADKLAFVMAYFVTISVAGFGQAWFAKKMGDDTAERLGFLTFSPAAHFSLFGFLLIFIFNWGFGNMVPINAENFRARSDIIRKFKAFFIPAAVHFMVAVGTLLVMIMLGGFVFASPTALLLPANDSLLISSKMFLKAMLSLNILLTTIHVVWGLVHLCIDYFALKFDASRSFDIMLLIASVLFIFIGTSFIEWAMYMIVIIIEWFVNLLLSLLT